MALLTRRKDWCACSAKGLTLQTHTTRLSKGRTCALTVWHIIRHHSASQGFGARCARRNTTTLCNGVVQPSERNHDKTADDKRSVLIVQQCCRPTHTYITLYDTTVSDHLSI